MFTHKVLSAQLSRALFYALSGMGGKAWVAGGWVRDYVLGRQANDADLVVDVSSLELCQRMVRFLGCGTLVPLGTGEEEACRLVCAGEEVDVSSFRLGAKTIEEDLVLRDFSCNAMAFSLDENENGIPRLIDPCNGQQDVGAKLLVPLPQAFKNDSLRILRAYRFWATYGLAPSRDTRALLSQYGPHLEEVAAERKSSELSKIVCSPGGDMVLQQMDADGILSQLLPELVATKGLAQPAAHHLDVWEHSWAAYSNMLSLVRDYEELMREKDAFYCVLPTLSEEQKNWLLWAALLHDIGKKPCAAEHPKDGRPTFYHHDTVGAKMVGHIARRFRWSKSMEKNVGRLVELHMYPFHLCSSQDVEQLSVRAALKFYRKADHLLVSLFYMALADSLASLGEGKPQDMEKQLQQLYLRVQEVYTENIEPMDTGPRLVTGHDVMTLCAVPPGPQVKAILLKIEGLQVEGLLQSRDDAMAWLKKHCLDLSKWS